MPGRGGDILPRRSARRDLLDDVHNALPEARMHRVAVALALSLALPSFGPTRAQEDLKQAPSCRYCGMDREKFGATRMAIEYEDGTTVATCSLHCTAVELALAIDKTPKVIWVADVNTRALLDAEKAFWVVGGTKPGVMTARAKWAFADRASAEAFVKASGGTLATFDEAMKAAYEDMYSDTKMIRERRKAKRAKAAEKS
jgi:nitrous oxide reductase accessory protein NosL